MELGLLGLGGTGHSRELVVEPEVVLNGDRGERLRLTFDLNAFLCFNGLVQTFGPATAVHGAAGELVDDQHLTFLHDVVHIALEQRVRAQQLVNDVQPLARRRVAAIDLVQRFELLRR